MGVSPMPKTVCVLALDAADYELARRWGCENLLLDNHRALETFAYSKDEPYTPEVWSTVATGVGPEEHGIGERKQDVEWDNPVLRLGSRVSQHFPPRYRQALGRPFRRRGATQTFQTVNDECSHPFDATLSWPGLGEAEHLRKMWTTADKAVHDDLDEATVRERLHGLTGQECGWLAAMAETDRALVGAHAHVLDIAGHLYSERPKKLREWYQWTDEQVGELRERCERLVLLSDHGMQTTAVGDGEPGSHSWRAYIATQGVEPPLPGDVHDVREFLEDWAGETRHTTDERVRVDTPTDTLEDLGYIES